MTSSIRFIFAHLWYFVSLEKEFNEVNDARNFKRDLRNDLIKQRTKEFMDGFETITDKVKQMYQMITLGGDAELEMVNTLAPFEVWGFFSRLFMIHFLGWSSIHSEATEKELEKYLELIWWRKDFIFPCSRIRSSSLQTNSLVCYGRDWRCSWYVTFSCMCAISYFSISDIKNVSIVAHYIKDRTKNAQFIIISLRNQMFDLASKLVGIYKTDNTTKTVVMQNEQAKSTSEQTQKVRNSSGSQIPGESIGEFELEFTAWRGSEGRPVEFPQIFSRINI